MHVPGYGVLMAAEESAFTVSLHLVDFVCQWWVVDMCRGKRGTRGKQLPLGLKAGASLKFC